MEEENNKDERLEVEINRIKEVLDKKIPQEDIEKKLKEKSAETISSNIKTDKDNLGNGIKVIPKKSTRTINSAIYFFSFVALVLLIFAVYLFMNKTVPQSDVSTSNKVQIKEVTKIVVKEKIVPKVIDINSDNLNKYFNTKKYSSVKCYDFQAAQTFLSKNCRAKISKFFDENKKSIKFEIIPVVSKDDNIIFEKIEKNIINLDKDLKKKIEDYLLIGLSRQRVLETSFYIKEKFGENNIIVPTNYYVKSKKNNKGVIIKAYKVN